MKKIATYILCFIFLFQVIMPIKAFAVDISNYPIKSDLGKPLNTTLSQQQATPIYGITPNGTGIATGVTPPNFPKPQEQKSGQWRYFGYSVHDQVISNPKFPADVTSSGYGKVGGYASTWSLLSRDRDLFDYNKKVRATNADDGDVIMGAGVDPRAGLDYAELLSAAEYDRQGSFRLWWWKDAAHTSRQYKTFIIPSQKQSGAETRKKYVYYRMEGTSTSLISSAYETESILLDTSKNKETFTAKAKPMDLKGYEFSYSVVSNNTSGGFTDEARGAAGETRSKTVGLGDGTGDFAVIFYYKLKQTENATLTGSIATDKSTYEFDLSQDNFTIPVRTIATLTPKSGFSASNVTGLTARITGYEVLRPNGTTMRGTIDGNVYGVSTGNTLSVNIPFKNFQLSSSDFNVGQYKITFTGYASYRTTTGFVRTMDIEKSVSLIINRSEVPIAAIEAPEIVYCNDEFEIIGEDLNTKDDPNTNTYLWTTPGLTLGMGTIYPNVGGKVSIANEGTYTITLKVTNSDGKFDTATKTIEVKKRDNKPDAIITAPDTVWANDSVAIGGLGYDALDNAYKLQYRWDILSDPQNNGISLQNMYPNVGGTVKFKKGTEKPRVEGQPQEYNNYTVKIRLTVTNSLGYSDTDEHTITVQTQPLDNTPPIARLSVDPKYVKAGDDVYLDAGDSEDSDGYIEEYKWETTVTNGLRGEFWDRYDNKVWYEWLTEYNGLTQKEVTTKVIVTDNGGKRDNDSETYYILPPTIDLALLADGSFKENRKITLDLSIDTPEHYPVNNIDWTVSAYDGNADINSLRHSGTLDGSTSKDVLFKKYGKYKIDVTVTNTAGYSETKSTILDIQKDLPPIAKMATVDYILRDPNNSNIATLDITDISESIDNDYIGKRLWIYNYDSDNDGRFDDEITYFYLGGNWVSQGVNPTIPTDISNLNCGSIQKPLLQSDQVGSYNVRVVVQEGFGQPTIEEFITGQDKRTAISD